MRTIHKLAQGSPEWHAHRDGHYNASDAPAALNVSPYVPRADLVQRMALGEKREISARVQDLFDNGHAYEAAARPWAEEILGEELYATTASIDVGLRRPLSASFDGLTMAEDIVWEHKTLNKDLAASLARKEVPMSYWPQLDQQMLISGAKRCLFMASKGDKATMMWAWYEASIEGQAKIVPAWKQLEADVAAYVAPEAVSKAVADPVRELPAAFIDVRIERDDTAPEGGRLVVASNLAVLHDQLTAYIEWLPEKPEDDQEFANLEAAVPKLKALEDRLEELEAGALARLATVQEMRSAVTVIREFARTHRLRVDRLVKERKVAIRDEIRRAAESTFAVHVQKLNERLGGQYMPPVPTDFAGAMSGKKMVKTIREAIAAEMARGKIVASEVADRIEFNLRTFAGVAEQHRGLFPDLATVVLKAADDFQSAIDARIARHDQAVQLQAEQAREKIRAEEAAKLVAPQPLVEQPKPAPASEAIAPTQEAPASRARGRPSSAAPIAEVPRPAENVIVAIVAGQLLVNEGQALRWLLEMDFQAEATRRERSAAAA